MIGRLYSISTESQTFLSYTHTMKHLYCYFLKLWPMEYLVLPAILMPCLIF